MVRTLHFESGESLARRPAARRRQQPQLWVALGEEIGTPLVIGIADKSEEPPRIIRLFSTEPPEFVAQQSGMARRQIMLSDDVLPCISYIFIRLGVKE